MTTAAATERARLAALFDEVGPDAPTLCEGWQTRDLAAHLVVRERRPDAAAGVLVRALSGYTDKVQNGIAAGPWNALVERVRRGPPMWSPTRLDPVERAVNTVEFFVHHEDVRRAVDGWTARELDPELTRDLRGALRRMARVLTRRSPVGVVFEPTDGGASITGHRGDPTVTVRGPVGELVLFAYGRGDHAVVELDGSTDAVHALRGARLGL
jgi:uncharacterized protein (TIGR03085 family)